ARGPAGREELLRVGAGARAAGPRQPDLEAGVGAARHARAPACGVGLRGVQHFLESVHKPRRLDALRSSIAIGEVAWLSTEMLCGGPKQGNSASRSMWGPTLSSVIRSSGLRTLDAAHGRGLRPVLRRREAHPI